MNPVIFRENDVRGRVDVDISLPEVCALGSAIGTYFLERGVRRVVVGRDTRPSSGSWLEEIRGGLLSAGCDLVDIGLCTTPCLYFAVDHFRAGGGVMVTASHNPADFNGLKICLGPEPLCGPELQDIRALAEGRIFAQGQGSSERFDVTEAYVSTLAGDLRVRRSLRVGLDAAHGAAGDAATRLLRTLGVEVTAVKAQASEGGNGYFLDPAREGSLDPLGRLVLERGLDLGVAYDSDGDRLGVVGPDGLAVGADNLLILFARSILRAHPDAAIVAEVMCSQRLFDEVARLGGRAIMWKTGHSLVRQKMKRERALLAGELSGHFFFADRYLGFDDAIYAAGRLVEIVGGSTRSLAELLSDLSPVVTSPQIRIACDDAVKFAVVAEIARDVRALAVRDSADIVDIDGLRVVWPDGWAVVRASNTEPALVVRFEAVDEQRLESIRLTIMEAVEAGLHQATRRAYV